MEYTTQIIQHGKFTIRMHIPILTPEERAKREKAIVDTLTSIYRSGKSFVREDKNESVKKN